MRLDRKDIRISDTVLVQRAGDVIPEVVKVIIEKRKPNSQLFLIPDLCPICNHKIYKNPDDVVMRCINKVCIAKIKGQIEHFVSKPCMNIDGIGPQIVDLLLINNLIDDVSSLYNLSISNLSKLDRMGKKSATNIINAINNSKDTKLSNFLHGLGIRNVGQKGAKILDKYFQGDINKLISVTKEELISIHEVGNIMAESIIDYFSNSQNIELINRCMEAGVNFIKFQDINHSIITGKIFVFTGNLGKISRNEAVQIIEKYGAISLSTVSKKADYVIVGENAGSKLIKAKKLNLNILTPSDFFNLLKSL